MWVGFSDFVLSLGLRLIVVLGLVLAYFVLAGWMDYLRVVLIALVSLYIVQFSEVVLLCGVRDSCVALVASFGLLFVYSIACDYGGWIVYDWCVRLG